MSSVCFRTKFFAFVHKDRESKQSRALYSTNDLGSGIGRAGACAAQCLIRDNNQYTRDQLNNGDGVVGSQQVQRISYSADGVLLSPSLYEALEAHFGFGTAQENSILLALNLGISSSLWMLGKRDKPVLNSDRLSTSIMCDFIDQLFNSISLHNHDSSFKRTNFNVTIKCYEVFGDQIRDLMALANINGSVSNDGKEKQIRVREHPIKGTVVTGLAQKTCSSATEAAEAVVRAYEQRLVLLSTEIVDGGNVSMKRSSSSIPHQIIGTVGNVILIVEIDQEFLSLARPSGDISCDMEGSVIKRSAAIQFNFLCEMEPLSYKPSKSETICTLSLEEVDKRLADKDKCVTELASTVLLPSDVITTPVQVSQLAVCAKSMASLSRVVTMIQQNTALIINEAGASTLSTHAADAAQTAHVPYRESTLTRVLQPMLEGKYVNYIHCCLDERAEFEGVSLATATYALRLSTELRAGVCSRVVPNERFLRGSAPRATTIARDTHFQVSETAEIAKEITLQTSHLALEDVKRATERTLNANEAYREERKDLMSNISLNNEIRVDGSAFWDLLQSINIGTGLDYDVLEKLQLERARLLASLEGMIERADDSVASQVYNLPKNGSVEENLGNNVDDSVNPQGDASDQNLENGNVSPSSSFKNKFYSTQAQPAVDSASYPNTSPTRLPPGEILTSVRRSPHSEKLSPLTGSRPFSSSSSTSAPLRSGKATGTLSPLSAVLPLSSSLCAELSQSPLTPRSLADADDSSAGNAATLSSPGRADKAVSKSNSIKEEEFAKVRSGSLTSSSEKLQRTVRSQSVKGPRSATELSPVKAPVRRIHSRTVTTQSGVNASNYSAKKVAKGASLGLEYTLDRVTAAAPLRATSKITEDSATGASLRPLRVGKVTTSPAGLKTFVELGTEDAGRAVVNSLSGSSSIILPHSIEHQNANGMEVRIGSSDATTLLADTDVMECYRAAGEGALESTPVIAQNSNDYVKQVLRSSESVASTKEAHLSPSATTNLTATQSKPNSEPEAHIPHPSIIPHAATSSTAFPAIPAAASALPRQSFPPVAASKAFQARSLLPSERVDLSPAHEDAEGAHLSELEVQFLRAVSHTVLPEVARCIRMGVNIKVKNSFGRDAMQIAARNGSPPMLSLVHEHGGEISSRGPKGDTLYHLAASNGHVNVLIWLTEHVYRGAGLAGDAVDMYGQTAAHVAARRGEAAVLRYLHETLGVDVLQEDYDGRTPLEVIPKLFLSGNAEGLVEAKEFLTSVIELK